MFIAGGIAMLGALSNEAAITPSPDALEIHSGLHLKGELSLVRDVVLTGRFEGDLRTLGCLTVPAGGAAIGTIEAGALVLEPGHNVEARVKVVAPVAPFAPKKQQASVPAKTEVPAKWPSRLKKLKDLALGRSG